MNRYNFQLLVSINLILLLMPLNANSRTLIAQDPKGYYWYQDVKPAKKKDKLPKPIMYSQEDMMDMPPQDIQELLQQHMSYSLQTLKPEDVLNYIQIQDVARKKAEAFSAVFSFVLMQNAKLNAQSAIPTTNPGMKAARQQSEQAMTKTLTTNRDNFALAIFTMPHCQLCTLQKQTLMHFNQRYGWSIKEINVTLHDNLARAFKIDITPTIILIKRDSTTWMPISAGVESLSSIEHNVFRAVRLLNGDIRPQQFFMGDHEKNSFADPLAKVQRHE